VTTAPKRRWLQFRLMLMLLVVALFASLLAWRNAVEQRKWAERSMKRSNLETRILLLEQYRDKFAPQSRAGLNFEISELQKKIKELE